MKKLILLNKRVIGIELYFDEEADTFINSIESEIKNNKDKGFINDSNGDRAGEWEVIYVGVLLKCLPLKDLSELFVSLMEVNHLGLDMMESFEKASPSKYRKFLTSVIEKEIPKLQLAQLIAKGYEDFN